MSKWHYVYYSYEPWGRGYIGKRSSSVPPEQDRYMGSFNDKTFKPTEKIILATFENSCDAIEVEIQLHNFYSIDTNPHFANRAKQTSKKFIFYDMVGEKNPFYGKEHSQETKELLKQRTTQTWKNQPHPWIGKKHSEETKVKFRENNMGEKNPNYGKKQSAETKEKLRLAKLGRKLWNNGEQQKFSKECPGEGWVLGTLKNK